MYPECLKRAITTEIKRLEKKYNKVKHELDHDPRTEHFQMQKELSDLVNTRKIKGQALLDKLDDIEARLEANTKRIKKYSFSSLLKRKFEIESEIRELNSYLSIERKEYF